MELPCEQRLQEITDRFKRCKKAFVALGDETRQHILLFLLKSDYTGVRVGEISKNSHLSRPAVSHHLQILKEAGILNVRKEGTKNFYYINPEESLWGEMKLLVEQINEGIRHIERRVSDDER